MFAIIQGLYVLREDEEEDIERKKLQEKTNFQIWISSLESLPDESGYQRPKEERQKEKAAADERNGEPKEKGRTAAA